jgi:O-methyltransferase
MKAVLNPFGFLRAYSFKLGYWFKWHLPKCIISWKLWCGKLVACFLKKGPFRISLKIDGEPNSIYFNKLAQARMFGENSYLMDIYKRHMEAFQLDPIRLLNFIYVSRDILSTENPTSIVECGVYNGTSAFLLADLFPKAKVHLFDTFESFDSRDLQVESDMGFETYEKMFECTSDQEAKLKRLRTNFSINKGYFPDTIPSDFEDKTFSLVHLDMDLYQPTLIAIEYFYPKLTSNGRIIVHDGIAWQGIEKAVRSCQEKFGFKIFNVGDKSGSIVIA